MSTKSSKKKHHQYMYKGIMVLVMIALGAVAVTYLVQNGTNVVGQASTSLKLWPSPSQDADRPKRANRERYVLSTYRPSVNQETTIHYKYRTVGIREDGTYFEFPWTTQQVAYNPNQSRSRRSRAYSYFWTPINSYCNTIDFEACYLQVEAYTNPLQTPHEVGGYYQPIRK